jgi:nucleotide-binding universal stress UspA family protein
MGGEVMMYKRIVVPLDGSELAEAALPYAEELAARLGSGITLIHVYESDDEKHHRMPELYIQKMVETTKRGVKKRLPAGRKEGVQAGSALLAGHTAEQIVDYADREGAGLIVMATHGRSGIRRWVLGNVASKVARAAKMPVFLIRIDSAPPQAKAGTLLNKVLLPLDGSKQSESAVPQVEELAQGLGAEVVLLHVIAPTYHVYSIPGESVEMTFTPEDMERFRAKSRQYLETVAEAFKRRGISTTTEVAIGRAADEIMRLSEEMSPDLIAMSTHGRSGIGRWAFGSVADKVLHASNTPVLLVRSSGDAT